MLLITRPGQTDLVESEPILDALPLFCRSILEFTSGDYPDIHMFGRLKKIDIRFKKGRHGLRLIFDWTLELKPDGQWTSGTYDLLNFDDFSRVLWIAMDRPTDPKKILFYLPRGKQIYLFQRDRTVPEYRKEH